MGQKLFIRADATRNIGTGHVMRCIALAQEWKRDGHRVVFLSHCESYSIRSRIIKEGFDFIAIETPHPDPSDLNLVLNKLTKGRIQGEIKAWLVLDGYHLDYEYQAAVRNAGQRLFVIDDMAHQPLYHAEILLNQNIYAERLRYKTDSDTVFLLGTNYVLLRKEFMRWRERKRKVADKARKILVTLGGSDPENVTVRVIQSLNRLHWSDLEARVVLGPANRSLSLLEREANKSSFPIELLAGVEDMPSLMSWADVAVTAGGSTCWELAFMGLPSLIIVLAENQQGIAEGLAEAGAALNFGWFSESPRNMLAEQIVDLINDKKRRSKISEESKRLVDGLGTRRAIAKMLLE